MRDHAREAIEMCAGSDVDDFVGDRMLQLAVIHLCEIVGEAANRVPTDIQRRHPDIPWAQAIRFRHRVAHGYDAINLEMVFKIVAQDFPDLVARLDEILG